MFCPRLTKLTLLNYLQEFPILPSEFVLCSPGLYSALPGTLQSFILHDGRATDRMECMLRTCISLRTLHMSFYVDLSQALFDLIFQLPHLETLLLHCEPGISVHGLSQPITCTTLKDLRLFGFVNISQEAQVSISHRCSAGAYIWISDTFG